jgi:hypothetical protein
MNAPSFACQALRMFPIKPEKCTLHIFSEAIDSTHGWALNQGQAVVELGSCWEIFVCSEQTERWVVSFSKLGAR